MSKSNKFLKFTAGTGRLSAVAAALVVFCPFVGAGVVSMQATGSYSLDGSAVTNLVDTYPVPNGSGNVDVLSFQYGTSNVGLHSYGSTTGNFGSRSSGNGVYDVTGSFRIQETFTNSSGTAQNAIFNFFITPGQLSLDIGSALTGGSFANAGLSFDLKRDATSVWGSSATLSGTSAGTSFSYTGTNLYAGGGNYYSINGLFQSIDLGVVNAGASINIDYELKTYANGNSTSGADRVVAETSYYVPDQWIEQSCYGYGYENTRTVNVDGPCVPGTPIFIPGHTVVVPGYTVFGNPSGSTAQSGDPFELEFYTYVDQQGTTRGQTYTYGIGRSAQPNNDVPEPSSLALMLAGLGIFGWNQRRKRLGLQKRI